MLEGALRIVVEQLPGRNQVPAHSLGIRFAQGPQLSTDGTFEERDVSTVWDRRLRHAG